MQMPEEQQKKAEANGSNPEGAETNLSQESQENENTRDINIKITSSSVKLDDEEKGENIPSVRGADLVQDATNSDNSLLDEIVEDSRSHEEIVDEFAHIVEAMIFASDEPISVNMIKNILDSDRTFGRVSIDAVIGRIRALNKKYDEDRAGFHIVEIAGGFQFATRKELAQWVSLLFKERSRRKLTKSALETLAIIAYKQPITKPEIESIRGVNIDYVLHSLLERELVTVIGRADTVGRPLLYGTTQKFLKVFNLKNLEDLPKLREIDEIIKEIKSRGDEEPIQLEISALSESANDIEPPSNSRENINEH